MRYVHSVANIREIEQGVQAAESNQLMQHAAYGISRAALRLLHLQGRGVYGKRVLLLVGSGDNGGDALLAGAFLARRGVQVLAIQTGANLHEVAKVEYLNSGGRFVSSTQVSSVDFDLILDGIFGIGFRGEIPTDIQELILQVQELAPIIAIDVPSGVMADSGSVASGHIVADYTCVIGAYKVGVLTGPGKQASGFLELIPLPCHYSISEVQIIDYPDVRRIYPSTAHADHKYTRGVVVLDVGSSMYPGAGVLATSGARVSGAGMVQVRGEVAEKICQAYPDVVPTSNYDRADAIVLGCGDSATLEKVCEALRLEVPVVLDAGALSFLNHESVKEELCARTTKGRTTVITPHEGEAARLGYRSEDRISLAREMAKGFACVVVLKGPGTVIAAPNGHIVIDTYGTSALSCAGSGDVLAGLIGGTLATGHGDVLTAVASAVALHGMAGRLNGSLTTATTLSESISHVRQQMFSAQQ